jgi:hypothetical protein
VSDFVRKAFFDERQLVGARWWQEHLAAHVTRRDSLKTLGILAVGLLGAGVAAKIIEVMATKSARPSGGASSGGSGLTDDDLQVTKDAIELQRAEGWDVGRSGGRIEIAGASSLDVDGKAWASSTLDTLAADMTPVQSALVPYYVPTLFQSVASSATSNAALRTAIRPMHSVEMDRAVSQGYGLASLFADLPKETAVVVDMPGPLAVAFAAAMADQFEPVFTFDNWPHPVGVVHAHETLAAVLYFAPLLRRLASERRLPAPPVFVLDSNRLSPYSDASTQFDNRYLAKVPTKEGFASLGVKHLLYVTDGVYQETDDLNDDFVGFKAAGLGPKMVDRGDFSLASDADAGAARVAIGVADAGAAPANAGYTYAPRPVYYTTPYYYGGYPHTHYWFWHSYGWYSPRPMGYASEPPRAVSMGHAYSPSPRLTIFSGGTRPGGFGRVSVTTSRSTGHVTSTSYGGRSGSFGRSGVSGGGYSS